MIFRFTVQGSDTDQEAVEMATNYFCGGDFSAQVTQHEAEVREIRPISESAATEAR